MKKKFKFRKTFQKLFDDMNVKDSVSLVLRSDPTTGKKSNHLVNPQRRALKVLLGLPLTEQLARVEMLTSERDAYMAKREADNKNLENG